MRTLMKMAAAGVDVSKEILATLRSKGQDCVMA